MNNNYEPTEQELAEQLAKLHREGKLDDRNGVSYLLGNRAQRRNLAFRNHSKERRQYHKPGHKGYSF